MVKGYSEPSKYGQQRSWDRVNAVIQYLVMKQGISQQRFVFSYGDMGGNYNTVDLMTTNEEAMAAPAPPHPNLRKLPSKNQ